jgi:peptidoglycan/LPS O-acetylase OafA/YrhL
LVAPGQGKTQIMPEPDVQGEPQRNRRLDALRGAGALSVAASHCATAMSPLPLHRLAFWQVDPTSATDILLRAAHVIFNGHAAVLLFFVLSGHVLFGSLATISRRYPIELAAYGTKRLFRIMPLLIVSTLAIAILDHLPWRATIGYMLLLQPLDVTWTLQVEMIGSLLVFVALLAWRWRPVTLAALLALTLVISIGCYQNYLLRALPAFVLGCAVGSMMSYRRPTSGLFWAGLVILLLADLAFSKGAASQLVAIIGATFAIANASAPGGRFLEGRFIQWAGRLSYSIYLLHPLGRALASRIFDALGIDLHSLPTVAGFLLLVFLSFAMTLPLAQLAYRYIERPGIAAGRRIAHRLLQRSTPIPAASIAIPSASADRRSG